MPSACIPRPVPHTTRARVVTRYLTRAHVMRSLVAHPVGRAETFAREDRLAAELLLDAQQLVVLGRALAAAWCARLDLACGQTHRQVRDSGVL
jgi:hypothetical protein